MLILIWIWQYLSSSLALEGVPNLAIRTTLESPGPDPKTRLPFTTTVNPDAIDVFDQICFIGATPSSSLAVYLKTSFSRSDPVMRGQATRQSRVIRTPESRALRRTTPNQRQHAQSDKLPSYLQPLLHIRPARPSMVSSGTGLGRLEQSFDHPQHLEASRHIFSSQCIRTGIRL